MRKNYLVKPAVYPDGWEPMPRMASFEDPKPAFNWLYTFYKWYTQIKKGDYDADYQRLKTRISFLNQ